MLPDRRDEVSVLGQHQLLDTSLVNLFYLSNEKKKLNYLETLPFKVDISVHYRKTELKFLHI